MSKTKTSAAAAAHVSPTFQVPLGQLILDDAENVRNSSSVTKEGIKQMAAMLESAGQISPLVVSRREDGRFCVHAGGRRTRGFWLLRDQKKITDEHLVDVREIDVASGLDISLIENISQEPMHPVDEFLAYKRLEEKGYTPEGIAKAHGVKVLHVKRRMKLGEVHPKLLNQFRGGHLTLDQIMALASCDDQERQLQVWSSLPAWQRNDQQIRQRLLEDEVKVDDPRVQLVGLDVYLKAGGSMRTDLFSQDGKGELLTDVGLLEMLVADKLESTAQQLRSEGWGWVEILDSYGYEERQIIRTYPTVYLPETNEQSASREALEAQMQAKENERDDLYDSDSDENEVQIEKLEAEMDALQKQINAIKESRIDLNGVDRTLAGAVLFVDGAEIVIHKPMLKVEDYKRMQGAGAAGAGLGGAVETKKTEVEEQADGLSDRLITNLTAHRTAAVQASLIADQKAALAVLASHLVHSQFMRHYGDSPVKVSVSSQLSCLRDASPTFEGSRAQQALLAEHDAISQLLPSRVEDCLAFFLEQDLAVSLRVIAYITATSVTGVRGKNASQDSLASIAKAVSLDMRQWWEADRANYLSLVPKAKMIEAVVESHASPAAADGWDKLKKDEVLDRCADSLKGRGWLPPVLR